MLVDLRSVDLLSSALAGAAAALGATAATVLLLTPGYVFTRSLARGVRGPDQSERTVVAITGAVGVFTHLLFMPLTLALLADLVAEPSPQSIGMHYAAFLLWAATVLLVAPALAAALVVALRDWDAPGVDWIFRRLGLNEATRTTEAWHWAFRRAADIAPAPWLRIRLKNGQGVYYGYFGAKSLASSDARVRDVYLERTWPLDNAGEPIPAEQVKAGPGLWISGENILTVEFVRPGEKQ